MYNPTAPFPDKRKGAVSLKTTGWGWTGRLGRRHVVRSWCSHPITFHCAGSSTRRKEVINVAKNTRQTGSKAASAAGKVLANPSSTKAEKAAAASALSQSPRTSKKK